MALYSCEEEKVESKEKKAAKGFYELMQEWYLWYDQMPEIDINDYSTPQSVLEEVRYKKDYWSYITTVEQFEQYYEEGAYIGYGFGFNKDGQGNFRITFTYEQSPLRQAGVKRSWIIDKVDGTNITSSEQLNELLGPSEVGVSNEFMLHSESGDTVHQTFTKEEITRNTVIHSSIIDHASGKTGYLVLNSFIEKTSGELYEVFQKFSGQDINALVIDLRYNGGGMLSRANELADYLIEDNYIGENFVHIMHNDKKREEDNYHTFKQDSLSLNWNIPKVYFITTGATASASEALINGLKPFTEVFLIGQQTYGKPVGMYVFTDNKKYYAFVPVSFRIANDDGTADYYEGIPVDVQETDDVTHKFGDPDEKCLKQAMYHIENGTFLRTKAPVEQQKMVPGPAYRNETIIRKH